MQGDILANRSTASRPATDFYPTPPDATQALLAELALPAGTKVWEPACGAGHLAKELTKAGLNVLATDLHAYGYGDSGIDFLQQTDNHGCQWLITNPPFSQAGEFIAQAQHLKLEGFAFLVKSQFWHAKSRLGLFWHQPPALVLPLTWRPDFLFGAKSGAPTMEVCWCVWRKGENLTHYRPLSRPPKGDPF